MTGRPLVAGVVLLGAMLGRSTAIGAQPAAPPAAPPTAERRVTGQVLVAKDSATMPVANTWVTLHRVASDGAGPLDSLRTDGRGRYAFRYRPTGSDEALYFASTRYGGVAYFTPPLRGNVVTGEPAEITVFDTTTVHVPTTVRGRHLIVAAPAANVTDGSRRVIEVYEVSNDSSVTLVERDGESRGTWTSAIPVRARQPEVREGEVPADALTFDRGRAVLHMPLAPGLKQIAFSYTLPPEAFPLDVAAETGVTVFEVLVEDPRGTVAGPRFAGVNAVTVEGRSFRRFLAQDVPAGSHIVVDLPAPSPSWLRWMLPALLGVVGLAMVGALAWPRRRRAVPARAAMPPIPARGDEADAERLARAIASLDDGFERETPPTETARAEYQAERAALKARLATLLAGRSRS